MNFELPKCRQTDANDDPKSIADHAAATQEFPVRNRLLQAICDHLSINTPHSIGEIAKADGFTPSYVPHIMRLGILAPKAAEAILGGAPVSRDDRQRLDP